MDHGEFAGALEHLEKSSEVLSRCLAAVAKWSLGFPDQAIAGIESILFQALKTGNPEHCIFANLCTARVHMARRETERALERAQRALDLAIEHGLVEQWLAPMRSIRAWALAKLGQRQSGMEEMRTALVVFREIGASNLYPLMLGMFAELSMDSGQIDEGLAAIEEALAVARSTGMNHHDAELCRLKGELLLRKIPEGSPGPDDGTFDRIGACLEEAIQIARRQQAKSLELRATVSLTHILQGQRRGVEARKRLQKIYAWFTEGFDTPDLREARALLQQM